LQGRPETPGRIARSDSRAVVRFYNKRGTAEQWIKEGKQAVKMTRLSCHHFRSNEVRLCLSVLTHNLGNLWRRLVRTGGRLIKHARYYWLLLAESHLMRRLFGGILSTKKDYGAPITSRIGEP
jgi:hypothetical protein